jgi:hypothetical protein
MVMKAAEDGHRYDVAPVLDGPMDQGILVERPMCPQLVIVSGIFRQNSAQMRLAQDDEMVRTLAPDRSDPTSLSISFLTRSAHCLGVGAGCGARRMKRDTKVKVPPQLSGLTAHYPRANRRSFDIDQLRRKHDGGDVSGSIRPQTEKIV